MVDVRSPTDGLPKPRSSTSTSTTIPASKVSIDRMTPEFKPADNHFRRFPRLSRPVELLRHEYNVVVIGSGYGGGVAASRMARAGQSVCVLERGSERWPGEYPESLREVLPESRVSGSFKPNDLPGMQVDIGNPTGLYHLIVGEGQNAFVANGLGGTSLLNANVFLEADEKTLVLKRWPKEIRQDAGLEKYYKRARYMLQPEPYPEHYPNLHKLDLLQRQAKLLGLEHNFSRPPQTTRFVGGPNNVGVDMQASTLTGMDSTGLNDGSKNSTLVTYIADAWNWGAEIFCECEVRYIAKHPQGGYNIFFAWHGAKRGVFSQNFYKDLMWVHAREMVFVGAGTLGTTEILLRSEANGLSMSPTLGTGMSGNGDMLAFGYNCDANVNSLGRPSPIPGKPIGPTITGAIDCRDQENVLDGFVIEEGAVPKALVPSLQTLFSLMPGQIQPPVNFVKQLQRSLAEIGSRMIGPYLSGGSVERTQVYLVMSHDSNQAILTLKGDKPVLQFLGVGRSDHVKYLNKLLADATKAVGGTFVNNLFYAALGQQQVSIPLGLGHHVSKAYFGHKITVHPIGGACMSSDGTAKNGVTNHIGEVFKQTGSEVHGGLIVCDGALIPTSLGVNPFATITALAERSVEAAAAKRSLKIDYDTKNGLLNLFGPPARPYRFAEQALEKTSQIIERAESVKASGFEFSEVMSGFIYLTDKASDYETATKAARQAYQSAQFFLSIHSWDLEECHEATLTGTFTHGSLPASPYVCLRGVFKLFNSDKRTPDTTNLTYEFDMVGTDGSKLHFSGYKLVSPTIFGSPLRAWKATTTLYVTITKKDEKDPNVDPMIIGRGTLNIQPSRFGSELATLTSSGIGRLSRIYGTARFLLFFAGRIARAFFGPLNSLQWPRTTYSYEFMKQEPTETFAVKSSDGISSIVHYWAPTSTGMIRSTPLLLVPGASVDHQIFATPTIEKNSVEYFTTAGYHVYCLIHRVGKSKVAEQGWTAYDARLDIHAALRGIHKHQKSLEKIYVVCHCAGALTFSSGVLDGTIPASWIAGVTASNVFFNPIFAKINMLKAKFPVSLASVYSSLINKWYPCSSSPRDSYFQQALNQALRFYPVGSRKELCNSVVCHRSELVFGRLWTHKNLNEATHSNLNRFLGGTSMASLEHLMACGTRGQVLTAPLPTGTTLLTPANLQRFRGIPIFFFSGSENAVYTPESTLRSYETLRALFGPDDYDRVIFKGKGHLDCWMGQSGIDDVWPSVLAHITKTTKPLAPASVADADLDNAAMAATPTTENVAVGRLMGAQKAETEMGDNGINMVVDEVMAGFP